MCILGVNFFMGKFYKCIDVETGERFSHEVIPNRTVCMEVRVFRFMIMLRMRRFHNIIPN